MPTNFDTVFEHFFRNSAATMLLTDKENGRILDANDTALSFYGYSLEQMKSMSIDDITSQQQAESDDDNRGQVVTHNCADGVILSNIKKYFS
jgi:PAS domain S-box-containing protein